MNITSDQYHRLPLRLQLPLPLLLLLPLPLLLLLMLLLLLPPPPLLLRGMRQGGLPWEDACHQGGPLNSLPAPLPMSGPHERWMTDPAPSKRLAGAGRPRKIVHGTLASADEHETL